MTFLKLKSNTEQAFRGAVEKWEAVSGHGLERQILDVGAEVAQYAVQAIAVESAHTPEWDGIRSTIRVAEVDGNIVIAMAAEAFDVEYGGYQAKQNDTGQLFDDEGEPQFEDVLAHPVVRPALNRYAHDLQVFFEDRLAEALFG